MLRRSLLFVPGIATQRFGKAKVSGADAILAHLETPLGDARVLERARRAGLISEDT